MNLFFLLLGMVSCDTREDWFEHNSEGPNLIVTMNGVTDTIFMSESRSIVIDLHSKWLDSYKYVNTDTVTLVIKGFSGNSEIPMRTVNIEGVLYHKGNKELIIDNNVVKANLSYYYLVSSDIAYYENDTTPKVIETRTGELWAYDVFNNTVIYNVILNIYGPIPPTPILDVKKLPNDMEYTLSLEKSFDRDGRVMKYEWCIDGNIVPYSVTDCRFDHTKKGSWKSGQAAYGGTYITATTLSSVNHSFQTTGEHTVYYRCMDNMGVWSMWYSEKINVE